MDKTINRIALAFLATFLVATAAFAWNPSDEIMRLNKETPSFDTFGNPAAVIWMKNEDIKLNEDNSTEKIKQTVISFGERIPKSLSIYAAIAPADGEVKITHAGIYNPMNGMCEHQLKSSVVGLPGGLRIYVVNVPESARGRVLAVEERAVCKSKTGVEETVSMAAQFPIWEQKLRVRVPLGKHLYWLANELREPEVINSGREKIFCWDVINQPAWRGTGLVTLQRPYVSLTLKATLNQALIAMEKKAEDYAKCKISAPAGDANAIMKWLEDPSKNEKNLPQYIIRPVNQLPISGPWTMAERTLLLNGWLCKKGWDSKIWWQAPTVVTVDSTVAEDFWNMPVIVRAEGKKAVYYHSGQGVPYGSVSPFLAGTDIYREKKQKDKKDKKNGGIETKEIKAGNPADHKLTMKWNLNLDPSGVAKGTLTTTVEGAWAGLFSNGIAPDKNIAAQLIASKINFALPGMTLTPVEIKPRDSGYRLEFKVYCVPGISHNKNLLLKLPGGIPEILGELINNNESFTFRFPFIIEQDIRMSTPKGYKLFQPDFSRSIGAKKTSQLTEKITHNDVRNILEAECTWIVKKLKIDMDDAQVLRQQLGEFLRWPVLNLPFKKK